LAFLAGVISFKSRASLLPVRAAISNGAGLPELVLDFTLGNPGFIGESTLVQSRPIRVMQRTTVFWQTD
jgi:hypothetical protein